MRPFLNILNLSQEFHEGKKKKNCEKEKIVLRSKTFPWSLTATPHPILPPIPAARHLARRLDPLPSLFPPPFPSLPFPSLPLPSPSYPSAFYLSTNPLNLPLYLAAYPIIYLPSTYPSTYLPPSSLTR